MPRRLDSIVDVVEGQLCTGCGACASYRPSAIRMVDSLDHGRRPLVSEGGDSAAREALVVCPGAGLEHREEALPPDHVRELRAGWGPVLGVYEGHATDADVRFLGSSGGIATALSLFGIERGGLAGVLHTRTRADVPYLNETTLSKDREALLAATGSLYAPASPCDGLARIAEADGPCLFVGKPCDAAAASRVAAHDPAVGAKLALTVAIFCAGTPTTRGTLALLDEMGVREPGQVAGMRYRGHGWPGHARVRVGDAADGEEIKRTYAESWGLIQRYRQWRCYVCADHSGEFADIAVGDPWYREIPEDEPGLSLILPRSERGRAFLQAAADAGYIAMESRNPEIVPASQPGFLRVRGHLFARLRVLRWLGAAVPDYRGMPTARFWWRELSWREKLQSFVGTARRVFRKGLRDRVEIVPYEPESSTHRESGA